MTSVIMIICLFMKFSSTRAYLVGHTPSSQRNLARLVVWTPSLLHKPQSVHVANGCRHREAWETPRGPNRSRMIHDFESIGLRDATMLIDRAVLWMLNRPSPFSTQPAVNKRATMAAVAAGRPKSGPLALRPMRSLESPFSIWVRVFGDFLNPRLLPLLHS
jgi:hypothetical protein